MKQWRIGLTSGVVVAIGAGFLFFRSDWPVRKEQPVVINDIAAPPMPTLNPDRVAQGEQLYAQYCAACHGPKLEGKPDWKTPLADGSYPPPPHDNSGHTWHHNDELLIRIVTNGGDTSYPSKMPAFRDKLSQDEVIAILDFIKSKWGNDEREFQWWNTAVGDQQ